MNNEQGIKVKKSQMANNISIQLKVQLSRNNNKQYIIIQIIINYKQPEFEPNPSQSMSSSDSDNQNNKNPHFPLGYDDNIYKRKKDYICPCGKPYGSYPAIYAHIKRKHDGKAPGQIIKPKPIRRRGRPFKYEPTKLQTDNPHRTASKHLEPYLLPNVYDRNPNQYPLKQFAERNSKSSFPNLQYTENQLLKQKPNYENGRYDDQRSGTKIDQQSNRFGARDAPNHLPSGQSLPQDWQRYHANPVSNIPFQQSIRMDLAEENGENLISRGNQEVEMRMSPGYLRDYKQLTNQQPDLQNANFIANDLLFNRFQFLQQESARNSFGRGYDPTIESLYLKPFEIELRDEMDIKFKPITLGITHFLQPILQQLLNDSSLSQSQKPILINDIPNQKPKSRQQQIQEQRQDQDNLEKPEKPQIDPQYKKNQMDEEYAQRNRAVEQTLQNKQAQKIAQNITVSTLLSNQHFRDILKWLMSPPVQIQSQRIKENYIEFSFRCCLVEFLDFINHFLETVQHEQVLLALVFFCDHILAQTDSFQLQPEPQIYEMVLYLNSFINEYLPKLSKFMPCLEKFFIFKDLKKKISELFMWMSSWQAIQQYYHNKDHRQRVAYEISQENYKCMMYQRKYQSYMREAMRGYTGQTSPYTNIRPQADYINQNHQNQQVQEKTQENPELIILNTEQALQGTHLQPLNSRNSQQPSQSISKAQNYSLNDQSLIDSQYSVHDQIQIRNSGQISSKHLNEKEDQQVEEGDHLDQNQSYNQQEQ